MDGAEDLLDRLPRRFLADDVLLRLDHHFVAHASPPESFASADWNSAIASMISLRCSGLSQARLTESTVNRSRIRWSRSAWLWRSARSFRLPGSRLISFL